jgi:hypothetical protein
MMAAHQPAIALKARRAQTLVIFSPPRLPRPAVAHNERNASAAVPGNAPDRSCIALAQCPHGLLHIAADQLQRDLQDPLTGDRIFIPVGLGIMKNDAAAEDIEGDFCPHIVAEMQQPLSDLAEMLQRHPRFVADRVQDFEADNIAERVNPAVRQVTVFFAQAGPEKTGAVPIPQLAFRDAGKALDVLFAEGGYDVAGLGHRRVGVPSRASALTTSAAMTRRMNDTSSLVMRKADEWRAL